MDINISIIIIIIDPLPKNYLMFVCALRTPRLPLPVVLAADVALMLSVPSVIYNIPNVLTCSPTRIIHLP